MIVGDDIVVKIAGDRGHRNIAAGNLEVHGVRKFRRQNRKLNAASDLELVLNFIQLLVALQSAAGGHVSQGSKKCDEAEGLEVLQLDGKEVCHIDHQGESNEDQKP